MTVACCATRGRGGATENQRYSGQYAAVANAEWCPF